MSRIGKLPIAIPAGVDVTIDGSTVTVKGPQGTLTRTVHSNIAVAVENNEIVVTRPNDEKLNKSLHGLTRTLIANMVEGAAHGYKKELELVGVGYRASNNGNVLELSLGYSHAIYISLPKEVKLTTKTERNANPLITLESCDKALLGLICNKIRSFRKPEPYKGKGVLFVGEQVRRKSGKSAGAK